MKTFRQTFAIAFLITAIFLTSLTCMALELTPGLNILTGTSQPYDFEGDNSSVVFSSGSEENGVKVYATAQNAQNKAASLGKNKQYFYFKDFPHIEKERPVNYSFDYVYGGQLRVLMNSDTTGFQALLCKYITNGKTTSWAKTPYTVNAKKSSEGLTNGGDLKYVGGEDITNLSFMNYSATAATSYFDNISIVPAYKLSFDLNGGIGKLQDVYTFDASTSSLPDSSSVAKAGFTFMGWSLSKDSTQTVSSVTFTPGKDCTLYAVWQENQDDTIKLIELYDGDVLRAFYHVQSGKTRSLPVNEVKDNKRLYGWMTKDSKMLYGANIAPVTQHLKLYSMWHDDITKPGLNVFGDGSFEHGIPEVRPSNGYVKIVPDTTSNNILEYTRVTTHAAIQHHINWDIGRPYKLSYRFKAPFAASINNNAVFNESVTASDGSVTEKINHLFGQKKLSADSWYSYSGTYTFNFSDYTPHENDAISVYYNPNSDNKGGIVYYDDLEFIPYYKVTYVAKGADSVPASEYFLGDKYTVSDKIITKQGNIFMGWTLNENSVTTVKEVVPTPGQDITLYAVWESITQQNAISYFYSSDIPGIANGTISVVCPDELAQYTDIEVYFADDLGILDGYTPFATMKLTEGSAIYAVTGNRAFDEGVTRLAFIFSADGKEDITYWHTIPAEHRLDIENHTKKFTFWATSDSHLGSVSYNNDYWPEMTVNRKNAMADIFASDADFMFINGDVANYGTEKFADVLSSYLTDRVNNPEYNINKIPVFLTTGNHEYTASDNSNGGFDFDPIQSVILGQLDYIKENYPDIKICRDDDKLWYSAELFGAKFIFLSTPEEKPETNKHTYVVSKAQLDFLDSQLFDCEQSNKTAFVVSHVPLSNYVPAHTTSGYQTGLSNTNDIEKILSMHPNTLFCTGHSHSDIGDEDTHFIVAGNMTSKFSHINDGCLVWIDPTDNMGDGGEGTKIKSYSTGLYIRVYNDMIVIKGRKFLSDSKYFGHAIYIIPIPDSEKTVAKAQIKGNVIVGSTLIADIANEENYTFGWICDGNIVSTEKQFTIPSDGTLDGKYIYLRAIDKEGNYATVKSDFAVTEATSVNIGSPDASATSAVLSLNGIPHGKLIVVALYDSSDVLVATSFVMEYGNYIKVKADTSLEAVTLKAFVFDGSLKLKPFCEPISADLE